MTHSVWWWVVLGLLAVPGWIRPSQSVAAQPRVVTLAIGLFGGTDQEILECTFSIGTGASLMLHPKGEPCIVARELVGRTGTLMFVVD